MVFLKNDGSEKVPPKVAAEPPASKTKTKWYKSNTIQFSILVLGTGGIDLINTFVQKGELSWQSVAFLVIGLAGIALRYRTIDPIE